MSPYEPVEQRNTPTQRTGRISIQYYIRKLDSSMIVICAASFQSITGIGMVDSTLLDTHLLSTYRSSVMFLSLFFTGKTRLTRICKQFMNTGVSPDEKRGGRRTSVTFTKLREMAINFIKSLSVRNCHYSRSKSTRQYLPPELNMEKLYRMWLDQDRSSMDRTPSLSFFKNVFYKNFNLGFGVPGTDRCSACAAYEKQINSGENVAELKLQYKLVKKPAAESMDEFLMGECVKVIFVSYSRLHRIKAAKFHQMVRESKEKCDTLTVIFDMQQNQPLPKTGLNDEYYRRQLWFYNLAFIIHEEEQSIKNVRFYTWGEYDAGKGSNEVCSALLNFLSRLQARIRRRGYRKLDLIADSCPGQNKNSALIGALLQYVNMPRTVFSQIRVIFPVRGHSYMPADQVFGRVEKRYRKLSRIITPKSYTDVLKQFGRVREYGKHWQVYDYKLLGSQIVKHLPRNMPIRDSKIWTFKKNVRGVEVQNQYSLGGKLYQLKEKNRGRPIRLYAKPRLVPSVLHVSQAKTQDVSVLLSHTLLQLEEESFYMRVLKPSAETDNARGLVQLRERRQ